MGNVAGAFDRLSEDVAGAFEGLSRQLEQEFNLGGGGGGGGDGGPNLFSPNFRHALFLVTDFLTVEECFRVLVLDQTLHRFLSTHAFTWRMLFKRMCAASGEQARFDAERQALAVAQPMPPAREVRYLQQRILHHFQDRLRYDQRHFEALLPFDRLIYRYCDKFRPGGGGGGGAGGMAAPQHHGFFGMSSNLLKFQSRALADCLSLKRKNAARVCVMDTIMHPPAFKKSLPSGLQAGQASVSYLTLDMALAQARSTRTAAAAAEEGTGEPVPPMESRHTLPDLSGVPGFLGYACNMCQVRPEHEELLRDTVCWSAFMHLAVFQIEAQGREYEATLSAEARQHFWFCGLDYAPPADRAAEARFRRGYNFAYGDEFRPLMRDMVRSGRTPDQQYDAITRKLQLVTDALELSGRRRVDGVGRVGAGGAADAAPAAAAAKSGGEDGGGGGGGRGEGGDGDGSGGDGSDGGGGGTLTGAL